MPTSALTKMKPSVDGSTITVSACQMPVTADLSENLARILRALFEASANGCSVVAFPECALTGYTPEAVDNALGACDLVTPALRKIAKQCKKWRVAAVVGTAARSKRCPGSIENVAVIFDRQGQFVCSQSKLQLVPTDGFAIAGDALYTFDLQGVTCACIICHDSRHPELVRLPVLRGTCFCACMPFCGPHRSPCLSPHPSPYPSPFPNPSPSPHSAPYPSLYPRPVSASVSASVSAPVSAPILEPVPVPTSVPLPVRVCALVSAPVRVSVSVSVHTCLPIWLRTRVTGARLIFYISWETWHDDGRAACGLRVPILCACLAMCIGVRIDMWARYSPAGNDGPAACGFTLHTRAA